MHIDFTLKSLSNTRWSCRADSTKALWQNYGKIREALESISADENEKRDTRSEASTLAVKFEKLETALMANFRNTILNDDKFAASKSRNRPHDSSAAS